MTAEFKVTQSHMYLRSKHRVGYPRQGLLHLTPTNFTKSIVQEPILIFSLSLSPPDVSSSHWPPLLAFAPAAAASCWPLTPAPASWLPFYHFAIVSPANMAQITFRFFWTPGDSETKIEENHWTTMTLEYKESHSSCCLSLYSVLASTSSCA